MLPMRLPRPVISLAALASLARIGCGPSVRMPNLFNPGTAGQQRTAAIYHDPYPLEDAGPSDPGSRPQEYAQGVPEVTRSRLLSPAPACQGSNHREGDAPRSQSRLRSSFGRAPRSVALP